MAVDQLVPCGAAVGDDVLAVFEHTVGEPPVVAHEGALALPALVAP